MKIIENRCTRSIFNGEKKPGVQPVANPSRPGNTPCQARPAHPTQPGTGCSSPLSTLLLCSAQLCPLQDSFVVRHHTTQQPHDSVRRNHSGPDVPTCGAAEMGHGRMAPPYVLFGCCRIHLNPHVLEWIGVEFSSISIPTHLNTYGLIRIRLHTNKSLQSWMRTANRVHRRAHPMAS